MAPKYRLIYFDARGVSEAIRYLFHYGSLEFEDIRIQIEDWPNFRESMPFLKVPVLEVDGEQVHQSISICRYVAKQVGLAGENDLEALKMDALADTIAELRELVVIYLWRTPEEQKAKKREELLKQTIPEYFSRLEKLVKDNNGYLVHGKLSYADIVFAATTGYLISAMQSNLTQGYLNLTALIEKVENLPGIKEWIRRRPVTAL